MNLDFHLKAAASPALVRRGCVNLIGLESIHAQTGARWEKMRDSIYARLETMLSHKLGATDFFVRIAETAYLVIMPSADRDDARLSCLKIAYDLHRSLLGNCAIADLSLSRVESGGGDALEQKPLAIAELVDLARRGGIEELYRDMSASRPAASTAPAPASDAGPSFRYTPVWDCGREAVSAWRLEIAPGEARRLTAAPAGSEFRAGLKTFLAAMTHATRMLTASLGAGERYLMVIPVPFDVIGAPSGRMEIVAACRALAAALRPFLILEITAMPLGVPQSRMSDLVGALRPFCRAVLVELPSEALDHLDCRSAGHHGIGIALPAQANPQGMKSEFVKLAAVAKRLGLTSFVNGVSTVEAASNARHAGVQHLGGALFGPAVNVPRSMRRLAWNDLVSRASESAARTSVGDLVWR